MKTLAIVVCTLAVGFGLGNQLHSQAPAPKPALEQLKTIKGGNEALLKQQAATLQKLEELEKDAAQMRIFARRT